MLIAHRFVVAQFADQDHVGIFTQGGVQRFGERRTVSADFALAHQAVLALVHELDRIFDGQNVAFAAQIHIVDHRRERGRLARAGLAGHQDQTVVHFAQVADRIRHIELIQRQRLGGNGAAHAAQAVQVPHDVDAKTRNARNDVGEVGAVLFIQAHLRRARHDFAQCFFDELRREYFRPQVVQLAVQANARRVAGDEVQVRAVLAQHLFQELIDATRYVRVLRHRSSLARFGTHCLISAQPGAKSSLGSTLVSVTKRANSFLSFAYT
jgi:hypothetical protein